MFGPRALKTEGSGESAVNLPECELIESVCQWDGASGQWAVELKPVQDSNHPDAYQLTVQAPEGSGDLLATLTGESMYMGEYPVPLEGRGSGRYEAIFTPPFCSTGDRMRWRLALRASTAPEEIQIPKMVFQDENT
ncbi:hypothetical protein QVZ43_10820 [Marinobacter sp. chi1]|uniref:Uncharacterized protein n=1 Tax=Marinobacter suaedae TaxID=3057675 RepID=A0ABT8W1W6_9GAMM|nr:hypothetical protein [Marinobacter sp. chi1]MDO3722215.1 hypothetical protein [Marinobacter sp. chi1]